MALIGNITQLNRLPITQTGGTLANERSNFNQSGTLGNIHLKENRLDQVSFPMGYYRGTWLLPQKAGALSSRYTADGSGSLTANGNAGLGGTVSMSGSGLLEATGGLLAGLSVTMAGSGSLSANLGGLLQAIASMVGSGSLSGSISAVAGMNVTMPGIGTLTANPQGTGQMSLDIYVNQSEATVEQIVDSVVQGLIDMGATGGLTSEEHTQLMKTLTVGKFLGLK